MLELADEIEPVEEDLAPGGLDRNLAGALCYLIGPAIFLFRVRPARGARRTDVEVRFHAFQALLAAVSLLVVNLTLHLLEAALYRASWYVGIEATAVLWWVYSVQALFWLVLIYFGYELSRIRVPGVGRVADRIVQNGRF